MYGIVPIGSLPYGGAPLYIAPAAPVAERVLFLSPYLSDRATVTAR